MTENNASRLNPLQAELRRLLESAAPMERVLPAFLRLHLVLHTAGIGEPGGWSLEDEVFDGLDDEQARSIPHGGEHSIAWNLWHLARIEDAAMNLLVAGTEQVLRRDGWYAKMKVSAADTGNEMPPEEIVRLSAQVDLAALRAYRAAVGRRTREIVAQLTPDRFAQPVDPARIARVLAEGAVRPGAEYITDYWGGRTIAGLLLMPATRHNIVHLNEALKIKKKA
jgi:hypothetical protein